MAESSESKEQVVTPWTAQAGEGEQKIDYDRLIGMWKVVGDPGFITCLFSSVWK